MLGLRHEQSGNNKRSAKDVLMRVDVQGAVTVKRLVPEALMIFLAPPSLDELDRRLRLRQSESVQTLRLRTDAATKEMDCIEEFDYKVINYSQRLDLASFCIDSIITAEKCRIPARWARL